MLADTDNIIGQLEVPEMFVNFRVDSDDFSTRFLAGTQDSQRDFTTISNQNALNHPLIRPETLDDSKQRLVKLHRCIVFNQYRLDFASLVRLDLIHHFHRFDNAQDITLFYTPTHFNKGG